ncbi:MAG: hypothetical protein RR646_02555 [Erysipelotrichaceae bacterium]
MYLYYFTDNNTDERGFVEKKGVIYSYSEQEHLSAHINVDAITQDTLININDYLVINGELVYSEARHKDNKESNLRTKREPLLVAFDSYKSNVLMGLESTNTIGPDIREWYFKVLDLNEEAINTPPERIKYYLR